MLWVPRNGFSWYQTSRILTSFLTVQCTLVMPLRTGFDCEGGLILKRDWYQMDAFPRTEISSYVASVVVLAKSSRVAAEAKLFYRFFLMGYFQFHLLNLWVSPEGAGILEVNIHRIVNRAKYFIGLIQMRFFKEKIMSFISYPTSVFCGENFRNLPANSPSVSSLMFMIWFFLTFCPVIT